MGVAWLYHTYLSRTQVEGDNGKRLADKLRGLEGPWRTQTDREQWLRDGTGSCSASGKWGQSVGTIGAGNHFAEIQVVESLKLSGNDNPGLNTNDVVLLVHSGSRGYGGSILKTYTSESHVSLKEGSEEMIEYMREHDRALRWAKANRDLIALRFLSCLEPGEKAWEVGKNQPGSNHHNVSSDAISSVKFSIQARKVVDLWYNNLERVKWPSSRSSPITVQESDPMSLDIDRSGDDYVYVHRKGAAPTYDPAGNLPLQILPLPGSRGTPTLIMKPISLRITAGASRMPFRLRTALDEACLERRLCPR